MWAARSPIRSNSVTIRKVATMVRSSPATGAWRAVAERPPFDLRLLRVDPLIVADHLFSKVDICFEQRRRRRPDGRRNH